MSKLPLDQRIINFFGASAVVLMIAPVVIAVSLAKTTAPKRPVIAGTYACWSFNVGGYGKRCTSPALVLEKNGRYTMGSEKGTYTLKGNRLTLSKSKLRGAGTVSDDGMQVRFQYKYNGLDQTVTYLKREGAEPKKEPPAAKKSSGPVYLDITLKYSEPYSAIDSVSTIELVAKDGSDPTVYEALAYATDDQTLKAYYKASRGGIPGGRIYTVRAAGAMVGEVDLTQARGETARTINVKTP